MKADLTYAYHFTIKQKLRIVTSVQASFFYLNLNRKKLNFGDDLDPRHGFLWNTNEIIPAQRKYNYDLAGGLLGYGKQYFVGVGVFSFTQPDEGLLGVSKRPITTIFQGGYRFYFGRKFNTGVYAIVKQTGDKGTEQFFQYGANLNCNGFTLHLAHRINKLSSYNGAIAGVNYNIMGFKVGVNSMYMYSKNKNSYLLLETYLSMNFGYKREKKAEEAGTNPIGPLRLFF